MDVVAWILQIVLAVVMLGAGATKLSQSKAQLQPKMGWVDDLSANSVKAIAALEVLAAIGLILPWLLDIARVLTPLAAVGVAVIMAGAAVVHVRRGEQKSVPPVVVFGVIAVVVAILRFADL